MIRARLLSFTGGRRSQTAAAEIEVTPRFIVSPDGEVIEVLTSDTPDISDATEADETPENDESRQEAREVPPREIYEQGHNDVGMQRTCGLCSVANVHNLLLPEDTRLTENDVVHTAVDGDLCAVSDNPYESGGIGTYEVVQLIEEAGGPEHKLTADVYSFGNVLSVDQLADRLDTGDVAIVGVDSARLWNQRGDVAGTGMFQTAEPSDHWITVQSAERDSDGNVTGFKVIDSGGGVNHVDRAKFEQIYKGDENHRVSDPTTIVVSRNDTGKPVEKATSDSAEKYSDNVKTRVAEIRETGTNYRQDCSEIGKRSELSADERVQELHKKYSNLGESDRVDVQCIASAKYLDSKKPFNEAGRPNITYPKNQGFNIEKGHLPEAISKSDVPQMVDRYGGPGGSFVAKIENGVSEPYKKRALPFIENPQSYHAYDVETTKYCQLIDAVRNCDPDNPDSMQSALNSCKALNLDSVDEDDIKDMVGHYERYKTELASAGLPGIQPANAPYGVFGEAAPWVSESGEVLSEGGANQILMPLSLDDLMNVGVFRERSKRG